MFKGSVIKDLLCRSKMDVCFRFEQLIDIVYFIIFLVFLFLLIALISLCMFVSALTSHPGTRTGLYLPDVCGDRICTDPDQTLGKYLHQAVKKQYKQITEEKEREMREFFEFGTKIRLGIDQTNDHFEDMKPAGKLVGKKQERQSDSTDSKRMTPIRQWLKERESYDSTNFLRFGIKQYNGRLVVPVTGTYSMYSYVEFTEYTNKTSVKHEICRYSVLEDHLIVLSSDEKSYSSERGDTTSILGSYIFVVADLIAGDELSVRVSDMKGFESSSNNFFGLNII